MHLNHARSCWGSPPFLSRGKNLPIFFGQANFARNFDLPWSLYGVRAVCCAACCMLCCVLRMLRAGCVRVRALGSPLPTCPPPSLHFGSNSGSVNSTLEGQGQKRLRLHILVSIALSRIADCALRGRAESGDRDRCPDESLSPIERYRWSRLFKGQVAIEGSKEQGGNGRNSRKEPRT